ncbi:MAG: sulfotransferase [Pseudomonadota bacterium]
MQFQDIDFVIIGAAKSATTWLQIQLQADPAVYMPDPELHYFSREYAKGDDWYLSHFSDEGLGKTVGEKSNSYLYEPDSAARLHSALPHVKLIAQLRNPVERAYSNYCMLYRRGDVTPDINAHLDPTMSENFRFHNAGKFADHLQKYVDLYGREKLLILFFEGVKQDPEGQMAKVRSHLGLPPCDLAPVKRDKVKDKSAAMVSPGLRKNFGWLKPIVRPFRGSSAFEAVRGSVASKVEYPPLNDELRERLNDYFAPSIDALEAMSGQSLRHWYKPAAKAA